MSPSMFGGCAIQGRRFNGRPAVSKTASGGSNPSAPAKHPEKTILGVGWEGSFMAADVKVWVEGTRDYFNDLKLEMRRVTWPNRKQVENTTAVVIVAVFAFAGYFAVVDNILVKFTTAIFHYFTGK